MKGRARLHVLPWTDLVSLVDLLLLAATGAIIEYVLPPGSGGGGRGWRAMGELAESGAPTLWGWTRHQWGYAHYIMALVFLGLMAVHIALHFGWIKACVRTFRRPGRP